jgi:N-acetyl-anhydromuramyl-L-alanine amidase AmpD
MRAHALRYNAHSIGVCYEGGLDAKGKPDDTRTPAQKQTLIALLRALKADYPDAQILGHRDLPWVKKECPCFDARAEYLNLKPLKLEQ